MWSVAAAQRGDSDHGSLRRNYTSVQLMKLILLRLIQTIEPASGIILQQDVIKRGARTESPWGKEGLCTRGVWA